MPLTATQRESLTAMYDSKRAPPEKLLKEATKKLRQLKEAQAKADIKARAEAQAAAWKRSREETLAEAAEAAREAAQKAAQPKEVLDTGFRQYRVMDKHGEYLYIANINGVFVKSRSIMRVSTKKSEKESFIEAAATDVVAADMKEAGLEHATAVAEEEKGPAAAVAAPAAKRPKLSKQQAELQDKKYDTERKLAASHMWVMLQEQKRADERREHIQKMKQQCSGYTPGALIPVDI
jgi:hypothetical protein